MQNKNKDKQGVKDTTSSTATDSNNCYHSPRYRVRTHRGYHCNKCGKRL